jgi:hypothetical protein
MAADRSYVARNDKERARLKAIVARCSDADLARPMPAGWTVAGVLLHAAFWDQRILVLVERWRTRDIAPRPELPEDVEWINESAKPAQLAVPPRRAAELALEIAEKVDAMVAALPDDFVRKVVKQNTINLARADHRSEHLDDIERVLGSDARS